MSNFTHEQLCKLPLFRPARKIDGPVRRCDYGFGKPELRYGDECKNGHNTFSLTVNGGERFGGCCHDEIEKHWPELAHLIKWHLVSSDGPLHYIANTIYHANNGNLEYARSTAIAPDATLEQLKSELWLKLRLPALMEEFAQVMRDTFGELKQ